MVATSTPRSNRCEKSVTNPWLIATSWRKECHYKCHQQTTDHVNKKTSQQKTSQQYENDVTISIKLQNGQIYKK